MVTRISNRAPRQRGALMVELLVAVALLVGALLPLAYSIGFERRVARRLYQRAVAMELVDGELEILAAGGSAGLARGTRVYPVRALAATNLPPGQFLLSVTTNQLRLEWRPESQQHGGTVVREVTLR